MTYDLLIVCGTLLILLSLFGIIHVVTIIVTLQDFWILFLILMIFDRIIHLLPVANCIFTPHARSTSTGPIASELTILPAA